MLDLHCCSRVRVYVDGLNFYYGIARPYEIKWIDLEGLFGALIGGIVPDARIERILLFAARVRGSAGRRQEAYLGAMREHSPCIEWIEGRMQSVQKSGWLVPSGQAASGKSQLVTIATDEEKETDVNLACRIVHDAHVAAGREFDIACLVSNDSDIAFALKIKRELRQRTLLITPRAERGGAPASAHLRKFVPRADRIVTIGKSVVSASVAESCRAVACPEGGGVALGAC